MNEQNRPNEPHDKFIKQFVPIVLKDLFTTQTSVSVQLSEKLAIDVLCVAIEGELQPNESLGLFGRLVAIHPTIIIEHYSNYLDLEDIDSCVLRSGIYWELNKNKASKSRKTRLTKDSAMNPNPLHPDRPFTWIFAANCSQNLLNTWNAIPDPVFGEPVYRLGANGLYMGLVILESLPHNWDTMVLKMLGKAASVKLAIDDIIKLDPQLELRNDIIQVSIKYCVYLQQTQLKLTEEELSFMTYIKEVKGVEEAYEQWVKDRQAEGELKGKLEGKLEGELKAVTKIVRGKFKLDSLTPEVNILLAKLDEQQLDELISKIFDWQDLSEMIVWIESLSN
jgi:hypothetical protein